MSYHEFTHYIEIPIKVGFEYQPPEAPIYADGYPGCPEDIALESVEIDTVHPIDQEYKEEILEACCEQVREMKNGTIGIRK